MDPITFENMTPEAFAEFLRETDADQVEIPESFLRFDAEPATSFAADDDDDTDEDKKNKQRKFKIEANSGIPFFHPWWGNFAIDFEGLEIPSQKMGVLDSHDTRMRLGVTKKITAQKKNGIVALGDFLSNESALAVVADMDEGFPFQASVFVPPKKIEFIPEDSETKVNGHTLKGPGTVFRSSTLREVSIAALGADPQTSSVALSKTGRTVSIPTPDKEKAMTKKTTETPSPTAELAAKELQEKYPAIVKAIEATAFKVGVNCERERVAEILEGCHDRQITTAAKLVKDGVSVKDAFKALLTDQSDFRKDTKAAITEGNDNTPAGVSPREPDAPKQAALSIEEAAELDWAKDAGVRAEFDDKASYIAFRRANDADLIMRPGAKD